MKQVKLLLLIIVCTNIFASCKKTNTTADEPQLPPETHTGAYTFGCKVDGKIYTARGKGGLLANQSVYYNVRSSDTSIHVLISNSDSKFNFDFTLKYLGNIGIHLAKTYPYMATFQNNANGTVPGISNVYDTDSTNIGRFNIKYFYGSNNPMNGIAGTFEMDAINANGKVIHITEGRFDIGF